MAAIATAPLTLIQEIMKIEFKVGDIVGEYPYGNGTGEIIEIIDVNKALVAWYELSNADSVMSFDDLEIECETENL
jgi:hypothetical protein